MTGKVSRRRFLQGLALAGGGGVLAACQPKTVIVEVEKQVEKEVTRVVKETIKETVVVEGTPKVVEKEVTKIVRETVEVVKPVAAEQVTLVLMELHPVFMAWYEDVFTEAFQDKFPNITLKPEITTGGPLAIIPKMITMHVAGTPWDAGHWWIANGLEYQLAIKGVLKDLEPFVEADSYDLGQFFPASVEACRVPFGTLFMWPVVADPGPIVIFYNKDLFDEAGVPVPQPEWQQDVEWRDALIGLKEALNPGERVEIRNWDFGAYSFVYSQTLSSWGGEILDSTGREVVIEGERSQAALAFIEELYSSSIIPRPGEFTEGMRQAWNAGKAVMETAYVSDTVPHRNAAKERGFELGATLMPRGPGSTGGLGAMLTPHELAIHSDSQHPQEAWELLKFMTGDEMAESFFKDNGHFSARKKDWVNPKLMGDFPVYALAAEAMNEVSPYPLPWNLRGGEFYDALSNGLAPVWLGDEDLKTALAKTAEDIRTILDKPMAK